MNRKSQSVVLAVCAFALSAQASPLLDQAYDLAAEGSYRAAKSKAIAYLGSYPPNFKAEFIIAASDCQIEKGSERARRQMSGLKTAYDLGPKALNNVNKWLSRYCSPPPEPRPQQSGPVQSFNQGLGVSSDAFDASALTEPATVPVAGARMSVPQPATSLSGGDYARRNNVTSADACAQICLSQTHCKSMTYIISDKICWLKNRRPAARAGGDFVSAYKIVVP